MKLLLIPQDKANHFIYGFVIYMLTSILFDGWIPLLTVVFFAAGKEIIYDKIMKKGTPELLDFIFTIVSGLLLYIQTLIR